MNKYTVVKDFGEYKAGDVIEFNQDNFDKTEQELVAEGLVAPEADEVEHEVTQADLDANEYFASLGIAVGTLVPYDPSVVISREEAIAQGIDVDAIEAKIAADKQATDDAAKEQEQQAEASLVIGKTYAAKIVTSESSRETNGKTYHSITLDDGTTTDITDDEYQALADQKL